MAVDNDKIKFSDLYTIITGITHIDQSVSLSSFRGEGTVPTNTLAAIGIGLHFKGQTFASNDHPTIESVRTKLTDANLGIMYTALTDVGGTIYNINSHLNYGVNYNYISDGGNDMYDNGNKISFNSNSNYRTYTNTISSNGVGTGSYFVKIGPSSTNRFFIFVSDLDSSILNVQINGNLGADNQGTVIVGDETITDNNIEYKIYWKSVHDGQVRDPTVNHIWILRNASGISRDYASNTDNDYHKVTTNGVERIYYIMWAGATSDGHTSSTEVKELASTFLGLIGELYAFTSHTFKNCGATGRYGPTLENCRTTYDDPTPISWISDTNYFNMTTQGIQEWTVPIGGTYKIEALGASGGNDRNGLQHGFGAKIIGRFNLIKGEKYMILVGQKGLQGSSYCGSGGGGSFVVKGTINTSVVEPDILIIAGGGGGAGRSNTSEEINGRTGRDGGYSKNESNGIIVGGTDGGGGRADTGGDGSAGGGGFLQDGDRSYGSDAYKGKSFINGGQGGTGASTGDGGFGGGGAIHGNHTGGGGGGGFSGGAGGSNYHHHNPSWSGGGGGSYNSGASQENVAGFNDGEGKVEITLL